MRHTLRALLLSALFFLGHVESVLALSCGPHAVPAAIGGHSAHGDRLEGLLGSEQRAPLREGTPGPGVPHDGSACAVMLSCAPGVALAAAPPLGLRSMLGRFTPVSRLLPPPSRADAPANPPPQA